MRVLFLKIFYPVLALTSFIDPINGLINYAFITIIRPETLMWGGHEIAKLSVLAMACLLLSSLMKGKVSPGLLKKNFFLSMALFCGFFYLSTYSSFFSDEMSFRYLRQVLLIFIYCCCLYWILNDAGKVEKYLNFLFFFFLFMALWGTEQKFRGNTLIEGLFGTYITDRCSITGVYVLVLPIALFKFSHPREGHRFDKIFGLIGSIFFLLIIIFTESRAGFLGLIFSVAILSLSMQKKVKKIFIALIVFILILPLLPSEYMDRMMTISQGVDFASNQTTDPDEIEDYSSAARVVLWSVAFDIFKANPMLGVGNLNFTKAAPLFKDNYVDTLEPGLYNYIFNGGLFAHNMFFNILAEGGILVSVPFYLVLLIPLLRSRKIIKMGKEKEVADRMIHLLVFLRAGYMGWLVTAFFSNAMYIEYVYWIMTLLIILTYRIEDIINESDLSPERES